MSRKVYYESFGCQMNAYDTEAIESLLAVRGYTTTTETVDADVIIVNTCSVRGHAEERAIGRLSELARSERSVLVVCGCMSQRMGKRLFQIIPDLDIIAGTDTYERLPELIEQVIGRGGRAALLEQDARVTYRVDRAELRNQPSRYLSVTRGCENYCSYCIVPYLRGAVRSKEAGEVIREIGSLVAAGAREVTLLGQNVMAYRSGDLDFHGLLSIILAETAVDRLRFLTSHPRDLRREVFELIREHRPRLCPHLHLPVQAGSNRILELMRRGYTKEQYLELVASGREIVPDLALTTDVIVGFPTETEEDFSETLDLLDRVRFDAAFTFKYSPREGTAAASMDDDVPLESKRERLERLNRLIRSIREQILASRLGTETEILLDGRVKKGEYLFWKGRTPHFRNVLIPANKHVIGDIVTVGLKEIHNFTFIGEELTRR